MDARLSEFNFELRVDRESVCLCVGDGTRIQQAKCGSVCVCDRSGWKSRLSAPINGVQGEALVWEMSDFYGLESGTV